MVNTLEKATLSVQEVAVVMGASLSFVYELLATGKIPAWKFGAKWCIPRERFLQWFNNPPAIPITRR